MYNLINDTDGQVQSASKLDHQVQRFVEILTEWQDLGAVPPEFLALAFEHQYTSAELQLLGLKGHDYQRARCIVDSCARHGTFSVLLGQMELRAIDPNHEDSWEGDSTETISLSNLVELDGFKMTLERQNLIIHPIHVL